MIIQLIINCMSSIGILNNKNCFIDVIMYILLKKGAKIIELVMVLDIVCERFVRNDHNS